MKILSVRGKRNPADLFTRALNAKLSDKLLKVPVFRACPRVLQTQRLTVMIVVPWVDASRMRCSE